MDEVTEIKALYDKAQEEIKSNFEAEFGGTQTYKEKVEEQILAEAKEEEAPKEAEEKVE